jgi:hypothetical protein
MNKIGLAVAGGLLVACSAGNTGSGLGGGGSSTGGDGGGSSGTGGSGGTTISTGGSGGSEDAPAEVYGHSSDVLYKLDPLTKAVTEIGTFSGCSSVLDLAIDKDHNVLGTTFEGLYAINKLNGTCSLIHSDVNYPNSLSFVPAGTVDPNNEALVGYAITDYVRIDVATGAMTTVLAGALTSGYQSSGDIVSVKGGGTYLTIKGGECSDCLVEVNPATGQVMQNFGSLGYDQVFGLAFWGGSAYGFSNGGQLFEITFGQGTVTTNLIAMPIAPQDLSFWGAGSSTSAPITPPA